MVDLSNPSPVPEEYAGSLQQPKESFLYIHGREAPSPRAYHASGANVTRNMSNVNKPEKEAAAELFPGKFWAYLD